MQRPGDQHGDHEYRDPARHREGIPDAQGPPDTSRPPASPAQLLTAMDHTIATHLLSQQEMARRLGLNVTDLTCFAFVLEAGEDLLTAGDLAERAHVTTGAVTGILNRLERAGYLTRLAGLIADSPPPKSPYWPTGSRARANWPARTWTRSEKRTY